MICELLVNRTLHWATAYQLTNQVKLICIVVVARPVSVCDDHLG